MAKLIKFVIRHSSFVILILAAFVYFAPIWKDRQIPFPGHLLVSFFSPWKEEVWEGYPAGVPRKDLLGFDTVRMMGPWRTFVASELKKGRLSLWNPHQFMGAPLLANSQSAVFFPPNWFFLVLPFSIAWTLLIITQPVIAVVSMRLFLQSTGASRVASSIVALLYGFSGWMAVWIEWNIHGFVYALLPLLLFFIHQKRFLRSVTVGSLIVFAGHPQIAMIALAAATFYALARKRFLWFVKVGVFVSVITAIQWWPMVQYYKEAGRERESGEFSYRETLFEWSQLPRLVAPNIFGNPATENYSGKGNFVETTAYTGIALMFFALYGLTTGHSGASLRAIESQQLVSSRRSYRPALSRESVGLQVIGDSDSGRDDQRVKLWYPLLLFFLIVLFSFPNPISFWIGERHVPILSTSVASRWLMLFPLAVSMLGSGGFDRVSKGLALRTQGQAFFGLRKDQIFRKDLILQQWPIVSMIVVFAALWFWALSSGDPTHLVARRNLVIPSGISIAAMILIWIRDNEKFPMRFMSSWSAAIGSHFRFTQVDSIVRFAHSRMTFTKLVTCNLFLVALLSIGELTLFAHKTTTYSESRFIYPQVSVLSKLQELTKNGERFGSTEGSAIESNFATWFGLYDVAGYDALYPKRVGELVWASHRQGDFQWDYPRSTVVSPTVKNNWRDRFWILAGVKWILHKDDNVNLGKRGHNSSLFEEDRFRLVWSEGKWQIYENLLVFPRAFFVSDQSWIGEGPEMIRKIYNDPLPEIVPATIEVYEPTRVIISVNAPSDGYLVLTDTFYPGWKATIDGKPAGILPAFHAFRGIPVQKGQYLVELSFPFEPFARPNSPSMEEQSAQHPQTLEAEFDAGPPLD